MIDPKPLPRIGSEVMIVGGALDRFLGRKAEVIDILGQHTVLVDLDLGGVGGRIILCTDSLQYSGSTEDTET